VQDVKEMKISIQLFVTARKAVTIESSEYETTGECMEELNRATARLQLDRVKVDLIERFGGD
jgi:hypothetical protein